MIEKYGKSLRIFRVFGLLFSLTIVVANAREISKNATTIANDEAAVPTSINREDKMEARSEGETLLGIEPSTRSVEWKNSGPFTRGKDSYLDALRHSRTSTDPREGIVAVDATTSSSIQRRKEQSVGPVYAGKRSEISFQTSSDRDSFSMVPSDSYSLPTRSSSDFSGLKSSYGPPRSQPSRETYGPPREIYGPPRETYGPPYHDQSSYGGEYTSIGAYPAQPQQGETRAYGVPHGMTESVHLGFPSIDFSWPFALKLNAFTLAKILLKLVIFKMIVKFIAVICLLLFIPKLEIKKTIKKVNMQSNNDDDDDEDEGRSLRNANWKVWDRLNLLTLVVDEAWKQHEIANESRSSECSTLECQVRRAFKNDQSWPDYEQLLQNYIMEETRRLRTKS
ncbi:uncharacterized protein [Bombus flavifrons]|uniref:uncharacterized protein isoform X1 n=1 Tax=Bombus flavifrons TaxID=103934 RepID=UPI00370423BB